MDSKLAELIHEYVQSKNALWEEKRDNLLQQSSDDERNSILIFATWFNGCHLV